MAKKEQYIQLDAADLMSTISDMFAAFPELETDDELKLDTLEGETDFGEVMTRILEIEREANSMMNAIDARIKDLDVRKSRQKRKQDAMKSLMLRIMKGAGVRSLPLIEATISVRNGSPSVVVYDEDSLPDEYFKTVKTPIKSDIGAALKNGAVVPGARVEVGADSITIRVK